MFDKTDSLHLKNKKSGETRLLEEVSYIKMVYDQVASCSTAK